MHELTNQLEVDWLVSVNGLNRQKRVQQTAHVMRHVKNFFGRTALKSPCLPAGGPLRVLWQHDAAVLATTRCRCRDRCLQRAIAELGEGVPDNSLCDSGCNRSEFSKQRA